MGRQRSLTPSMRYTDEQGGRRTLTYTQGVALAGIALGDRKQHSATTSIRTATAFALADGDLLRLTGAYGDWTIHGLTPLGEQVLARWEERRDQADSHDGSRPLTRQHVAGALTRGGVRVIPHRQGSGTGVLIDPHHIEETWAVTVQHDNPGMRTNPDVERDRQAWLDQAASALRAAGLTVRDHIIGGHRRAVLATATTHHPTQPSDARPPATGAAEPAAAAGEPERAALVLALAVLQQATACPHNDLDCPHCVPLEPLQRVALDAAPLLAPAAVPAPATLRAALDAADTIARTAGRRDLAKRITDLEEATSEQPS